MVKRIESSQNQKIKKWKKCHKKKWRDEYGLYLIEGLHLLEEALKVPSRVQAVIYDEHFQKENVNITAEVEEYSVPHQLFQELSQTESPQGVIAVCKMPDQRVDITERGRYLLLDSIQDPGNLGTIIRTADACGLDGIFLGKGCADLYNEKTLRAAQGSHFHLPSAAVDLTDVIKQMKEKSIQVYGTALNGQELSYTPRAVQAFALLMGNEGNGVSEDLLSLTDVNVKIPIYGNAESLNVAVASGILMYWLRGFERE
ncbi:TrmH family RNA methyltransferase [Scopulibacillus daqui]|uniref:TrmH family RNA methyltransferase n=1 Tax=Scopulibacillus daqui TaxID=1469162 RepID=A0ABS2PYI8_9BACL|nr:RNA methyltransferase [Scopulibacillus daqui]MBM7644770.1 TrmH family RNA methyltransferase [Scopulibacillus daqui]